MERQVLGLMDEASSLEAEAPCPMRDTCTVTREALRVAAGLARLTHQARGETGQALGLVPEVRGLIGAALRPR
ncbi:MAG: hypothetical protein A2579_10660 [Lysobacterales bacterium RIFOXYD1_FULL_69_11]|nr:MAG: hypothetical protein A2190_05210 [Xanthomonadales bacterium RIFOXYA1_FULL_69_10]OHE87554.1 MAG: hypothetical protein A2579_10660 [Xanthomonadales bacterium RIFOXYD1_FULL_69_11]